MLIGTSRDSLLVDYLARQWLCSHAVSQASLKALVMDPSLPTSLFCNANDLICINMQV